MITETDITDALRGLGIEPTDTLYVHSSLASAVRVAGEGASEKTATVIAGLDGAVPDGRVIMPTFTYSFTRGEDFDVEGTPSTVGQLTEHFRLLPGARRIPDPIFSSAVRGPLEGGWEQLLEVGDVDCFGAGSVFDYLRAVDAKLVFFGIGFKYCTYVHHVEWRLGVPYRYSKDFSGRITDGSRTVAATATYFVRSLDGDVEPCFDALGAALRVSGGAVEVRLTRGPRILVTTASAVEREARVGLVANPEFLLRSGHPQPGRGS